MDFYQVTYEGLWPGGSAIVAADSPEEAIELVRADKAVRTLQRQRRLLMEPKTYTEEELLAAVYQARLDEREWAAKVADALATEARVMEACSNDDGDRGRIDAAEQIAAKIREGA